MHRILVDERRWLGDGRFLHALNFCMLLPGPEAQQLATYIGWLMHGVRGALVAGLLFILPGVVAIMALSWIYALYGEVALVAAVFFGVKAAVLAIVAQAVLRLGRRALNSSALRLIAVTAFLALLFFGTPFPLIVALAALAGWLGAMAGVVGPGGDSGGHRPGVSAHVADAGTLLGGELRLPPASARAAWRAAGAALLLWLTPVAGLWLLAPGSIFAEIALFFSKLAILSFGGAYAVLAWVAQEAAGPLGWLAPGEMLDGLGMAETTPGPLIMVLQFVGFMTAMREAGWGATLLAGTAGGLLATWVTFAPCFVWIFLGAPAMEGLRRNRHLSAALAAVTAAVVGVILHLAIWFAIHVVWRQVAEVSAGPVRLDVPVLASIDPAAAFLAAGSLIALFVLRKGIGTVLAGAALGGVALHLAGLA